MRIKKRFSSVCYPVFDNKETKALYLPRYHSFSFPRLCAENALRVPIHPDPVTGAPVCSYSPVYRIFLQPLRGEFRQCPLLCLAPTDTSLCKAAQLTDPFHRVSIIIYTILYHVLNGLSIQFSKVLCVDNIIVRKGCVKIRFLFLSVSCPVRRRKHRPAEYPHRFGHPPNDRTDSTTEACFYPDRSDGTGGQRACRRHLFHKH